MRHRSRDKEISNLRDDKRESSDYNRSRNHDSDTSRKRARSPLATSLTTSRYSSQQLLRTKVFVGNIHDSVTSTDLRKLFEPYGHIVECDKIPTKDYAFVHFETAHEAERAVKMVQDIEIKGRRLIVQSSINSKPPQLGGDLSSDEYQSKSSRVKSSIRIAENGKTLSSTSTRLTRHDRSRSPIYRSNGYDSAQFSSSRSRRDPYVPSDYHDRLLPPRDYAPLPPPPPPYGSSRMYPPSFPEYYDRNDLAHELLEARHPPPPPPPPPHYYSRDRPKTSDYYSRSPPSRNGNSFRDSIFEERFPRNYPRDDYRDPYTRRPPSPPPQLDYHSRSNLYRSDHRALSRERHLQNSRSTYSSRYEAPQPPPTPPLPHSRIDYETYHHRSNGDYKQRRDRDRNEDDSKLKDKQRSSKRRKSE